jgi:hypothetical protein
MDALARELVFATLEFAVERPPTPPPKRCQSCGVEYERGKRGPGQWGGCEGMWREHLKSCATDMRNRREEVERNEKWVKDFYASVDPGLFAAELHGRPMTERERREWFRR